MTSDKLIASQQSRSAPPEPAVRRGAPSASIARYEASLQGAAEWLLRSIAHGQGGSCAYYGAWGQWAKPYPETTGYIIPTLLDYAGHTGAAQPRAAALGLGEWLLSIQDPGGYWHGGTHPAPRPNPSVFNTAQILLGLAALYRETGAERWIEAAQRGAGWLGNYRDGFNPSYYTRVAWPMLEVWKVTREAAVREAAERVLHAILARRRENGVIAGWGFAPGKPAFTHTIAYTLRGLIESARLLDDWPAYGQPAEAALERLFRQAELRRGRLPGAYHEDWSKVDTYTCLTGNAQVALCLLAYEARTPDLRLVNAACKLVDGVCASQSLRHPVAGIRGAVAGSSPLWGRYLTMRYPNWAAKFHGDALMRLGARLGREGL